MNIVLTILASLVLLLGLISMVTPIPGGVLMITGGLTVLICTSPTVRFCLRWIRSHYEWFNKIFFWLEKKVGGKINVIGNALKQTHPINAENDK